VFGPVIRPFFMGVILWVLVWLVLQREVAEVSYRSHAEHGSMGARQHGLGSQS